MGDGAWCQGVRDPQSRQADRMCCTTRMQRAVGVGSGASREAGGSACGLGADRRDSCASPSWGGSSLWMSVCSSHPPSPALVSPSDTPDTHLTGWGGFGGPSLGSPAADGQQSPFQPKWSAEGGESLRLAHGRG